MIGHSDSAAQIEVISKIIRPYSKTKAMDFCGRDVFRSKVVVDESIVIGYKYEVLII